MKTVAIYNGKGGSGKTNLAIHVAVVAAHTMRTAILDLDTDMQYAWEWSKTREQTSPAVEKSTAAQLPKDLAKLAAAGVELTILDFPPNLSITNAKALAMVDLIVVPVQPSAADINGFLKAINIIQSSEKPFVFVMSRTDKNDPDVADAVTILSQYSEVCPTHLGDRKVFKRSMSAGLSVIEFQRTSVAATESVAVCEWILKKLNGEK